MDVLVTGGAGYIGSHACKALAAAGHRPISFDNLQQGHRWAVQWGPLVEGDLLDDAALSRALAEHPVEAVMHFAAATHVGESMSDPGKYFRNNVTGTLKLLDAMAKAGVDKFVFSSTCATYGEPARIPIVESEPQNPVNPYGESKLFVERALPWYEKAHGLRSVCLRYFNAAGSDPDGVIGECHDPETHLIPLVIEAALGLRPAVKIFGSDYDTPDGTAVRDYIHVTDLADAHVKALEGLASGQQSACLNLGTGTGHSVRQVVDCVRRITGRDFDALEVARRPGDAPVLVAQPGRANEMLGWKPTISDLDTIVSTALRWLEKTRAVQ